MLADPKGVYWVGSRVTKREDSRDDGATLGSTETTEGSFVDIELCSGNGGVAHPKVALNWHKASKDIASGKLAKDFSQHNDYFFTFFAKGKWSDHLEVRSVLLARSGCWLAQI